MPEYKLIYFNLRGRAELTRWIFAYAGIPYTDERIEKEDWPAMKSTIPFGKLPCLMIDGKPLPQSSAIARYVAKEAGLVPEDNLLAAYCDAVVDTLNDIAQELFKLHMMTDEAERKKQYAELNQKTLAPALSYINKKLEEKDWIVSGKISPPSVKSRQNVTIMPEYKLIYFNLRGRAELTRWIFAYAGIPYTDERIEKEDWPAMKSTIPTGKLPCLMIDGKPLPQSHAIARYVAKEAGLVPEDNLQCAYCEAAVDTLSDIAMELYKLHVLTDEEERKKQYTEVREKTVEPALDYLEKQLDDNEWIVGEQITWADLAMGSILGAIVKRKEDFLASHPKLESHVKKIQSLPKIQEWIENSPETEM